MKILTIIISIFLFSCNSSVEQNRIETKSNVKNQENINETRLPITVISVNEFAKQIKLPCTILDVRTPEEVLDGFIANSININIANANFAQQVKTLDKTIPVCVYCRSGGRSSSASEILAHLGFKVYNMDGGLEAWKAAGKEVKK